MLQSISLFEGVSLILVITNHWPCALIDCYRTLANSHLSVALMRWESMEMRSLLCNVMEE